MSTRYCNLFFGCIYSRTAVAPAASWEQHQPAGNEKQTDATTGVFMPRNADNKGEMRYSLVTTAPARRIRGSQAVDVSVSSRKARKTAETAAVLRRKEAKKVPKKIKIIIQRVIFASKCLFPYVLPLYCSRIRDQGRVGGGLAGCRRW